MKARPIGITILALLFALNVGAYAVFAVLAVFNHGALVAVLHTLSPSGAGPETIHSSMGRVQPLYYSAMAVLTCAMAVGFWKLQNWARIVMLALITVSLVLMTTALRPLLAAPTAGAIILTLVRVALSVFWLWYLLRLRVRDVFRREAAQLAIPHIGNSETRWQQKL
jgi:hypothetical protein